ncbi:hypothetical protein BKA70DRAFT_1226282 [Coprinopsis sp. MPI-PUGE-AT-0042]|nr:hypothetical protein BKA70DRAFT_1226282 [Coprinopsis sp. MPI-PUGE-AT-0042]
MQQFSDSCRVVGVSFGTRRPIRDTAIRWVEHGEAPGHAPLHCASMRLRDVFRKDVHAKCLPPRLEWRRGGVEHSGEVVPRRPTNVEDEGREVPSNGELDVPKDSTESSRLKEGLTIPSRPLLQQVPALLSCQLSLFEPRPCGILDEPGVYPRTFKTVPESPRLEERHVGLLQGIDSGGNGWRSLVDAACGQDEMQTSEVPHCGVLKPQKLWVRCFSWEEWRTANAGMGGTFKSILMLNLGLVGIDGLHGVMFGSREATPIICDRRQNKT